MSTSLHVTTVTRFGATTQVIEFDKWTDAVNAKSALEGSYEPLSEVAIVVTILEGTA
jgi:hypothetical protein